MNKTSFIMDNILYIITPSKFLQCFTDFIIHKQNMKFTVNIYAVENIGKGTFDDIKNFLDAESERMQKEYYVILGGDAVQVPGKSEKDGDIIKCNDSAYACDNNNSYSRSIGRLPASCESEMTEMCTCAINYESHFVSFRESVLMIGATNNNIDQSKSIAAGLRSIVQNINEQYTTTIGGSEILESLRANIESFVNYMGHGGSDKWTLHYNGEFLENIISTSLPLMEYKPSHILSWACNTANITHPNCIGKRFLLNGAVSFWGAYRKTLGSCNRIMASYFWDEYKSDTCPEHIGEIYLSMCKKYKDIKKGIRYMLLGAPTLKIR